MSRKSSRNKKKVTHSSPSTSIPDIKALMAEKNYEKVVSILETKPDITDDERAQLAVSLAQLQRYSEAVTRLMKIKDKKPSHYGMIGFYAIQEEDWDVAHPNLETFVELEPENPYGHYWLAWVMARGNSYFSGNEGARGSVTEHLQRAISLPQCPEQPFLFLHDIIPAQEFEARRELLEKGLALWPDSYGLRMSLGRVLAYWGDDFEGALETIKSLLEDKDLQALILAYSIYHNNLESFETALKTLDAIEFKQARGLFLLKGEALLELGRFSEAEQAYLLEMEGLEDLEVDVRGAVLIGLTRVALAREELPAAQSYFKQFLEVLLDNVNYGFYPSLDIDDYKDLYYYEQYKEIERLCRDLINRKDKIESWVEPAASFVLYKIADDTHKHSEEESPKLLMTAQAGLDHPAVSQYLVYFYLRELDLAAVVEHDLKYRLWSWEKTSHLGGIEYYEIEEQAPGRQISMALRRKAHQVALQKLREYQAEKDIIEEVFVPFFQDFWRPLLFEGKLFKEALAALKIITAVADDNRCLFDYAYCLNATGRKTESISIYKQVIANDPEMASAWHNLSILLEGQGLMQDAVQASQKAAELMPDKELFTRRYTTISGAVQERISKEQAQASQEQRRREAILKYPAVLPPPTSPLHDLSQLTMPQAVYLLSIIRLGLAEDLSHIRPWHEFEIPLAPTENYCFSILAALADAHLLIVHPQISELTTFVFEKDDSIKAYFPLQVCWYLPTEQIQETVNELEQLVSHEEHWPKPWHEQWGPLWRTLALHESLEYLDVVLKEHSLSMKPGEKTHLMLEQVLKNFSVAQVYNLIWRAGRDAAAFFMRGGVTKPHAANTVVGSIQRYAEQAVANGWEIKGFRRDRRCPRSMVSHILFDTALKIGDTGFTEKPA